MRHLPSQLDKIVASLNGLTDDIEQLQKDNKKLNDDILILENSRDEGYKSFNTETHILVSRDSLKKIKEDIEEARSSSNYAYDECRTAESCVEDARTSANNAEDYSNDALCAIDSIIEKADRDNNNNKEEGESDGEE